MKNCFRALFVFAAVLCTSSAGAQEANVPAELPKVLLIGDSISNAYTPFVVLALKGKAVVQHHPGNAGPTMRGVENLDAWLGDTKWDLIHFNWGLWDMYGWQYEDVDRTPPAYAKRLEELVTRLEKTGAHLIWATTTPACPEGERKCKVVVDAKTEQAYLDAASDVMKAHHISVNDLYAFMKPQREQYGLAANDVHYNKEGSKALGNQVADAITKKLASPGKRP